MYKNLRDMPLRFLSSLCFKQVPSIAMHARFCQIELIDPTPAGDRQLSFPLIQLFVVKLNQLANFDKTSDACQCMKLVIV